MSVCVPGEEHTGQVCWSACRLIDQTTHERAPGHELLHKGHVVCPSMMKLNGVITFDFYYFHIPSVSSMSPLLILNRLSTYSQTGCILEMFVKAEETS